MNHVEKEMADLVRRKSVAADRVRRGSSDRCCYRTCKKQITKSIPWEDCCADMEVTPSRAKQIAKQIAKDHECPVIGCNHTLKDDESDDWGFAVWPNGIVAIESSVVCDSGHRVVLSLSLWQDKADDDAKLEAYRRHNVTDADAERQEQEANR